jgi:RED-like protein N-terminal region
MNNDQFRRLLLDQSKQSAIPAAKSTPTDHGPKKAPSTVLGGVRARPRTSVYMAPRNVKPAAPDRKKSQFRSAAPKGSRLADGFVDRAGTRRDDDDADDVAARVVALEKSLKDGDIDDATFARLRDEITGGRLEHTHLVKGLDFKLLERVRRGENVLADGASSAADGLSKPGDAGGDVDDEFDQLEKTEVVAVARESTVKKGELAKLAGVAGRRTRNEILAALKASRKRAAEEERGPQLGSKFRKIGAPEEQAPRLEIDSRGREVLIVTEADGTVKRKVRKRREGQKEALPMPDVNEVPLGADVAVVEAPPEESDDGDIYADIGDDYDPLAELGEDDGSSGDSDGEVRPKPATKDAKENHDDGPDTEAKPQAAPRNYFNDDPSSLSVLDKVSNPLHDPAILAALAKKQMEKDDEEDEATKKEAERKAALMRARDRDLEDMDMGFGGSRFEDEEEMAMDSSKVKLSEWNDGKGAAYDDDDGGKGEKKKRKRKRKGDKNSVADVLRVIESRKE